MMVRWVVCGALVGALYSAVSFDLADSVARFIGQIAGGTMAGALMFGLGRAVYSTIRGRDGRRL